MRIAWGAVLAVALSSAARAQDLPPDHDHDHGRDERPFPKLTITARVTEEKAPSGQVIRYVEAEGETGYPDGAVIVVDLRLKEADGFIEPKYVGRAVEGKWKTKSIPLDRKIYTGAYVVRASFDPGQQPMGFQNRLNAELNPELQYVYAEVQIGTAEEMAAEAADVKQFYLRRYRETREIVETLLAEFDKQKQATDLRAWGARCDETMEALLLVDRRVAEWRTYRLNLILLPIYEDLSRIHAGYSYALMALTAALGNGTAPASAAEKQAGEDAAKDLRATLTRLEKALEGVKEDAGWKEPEKPKLERVRQTPPPVGSLDPVGPISSPQPQGPARRRQDGMRIGWVEGAVGAGVVAGIVLLAVLLRRKQPGI